LSADAPPANEVDLTWIDHSNNETGFKVQRRTAGTSYQTIFTSAAGATSYADMTVDPNTTYFYQILATNSAGDSTPSNEFQVSTPASAPQTSLTSVDIGSPSPAGSTNTITDGVDYDITAGGANIWGSSDQFRYAYEQVTGDFDVKVQITGLTAADPKAKAGIMARSSLDANAANAYMRLNPIASNGPRFAYRTTDGGSTGTFGSGTGTAPMWVRLQRVGNTFTGYVSSDDVNWTLVGSSSITMGQTIYLGLATAADTAGQTAVANYRSFGDTVSQPIVTIPNAASNLAASASSPTQVDLNWTDHSDNETGFKVQRRTSGGTYQTIFTTAAGATSYSDATADPGTTYFYQIVATNSAGDSTPSNEFGVSTPSALPTHTFTAADIGNPAKTGSTNALAADQFDVTGGGSDVWNTSDQAQFENTHRRRHGERHEPAARPDGSRYA
jgi:hypothetical protein